MTRNIPSFSFSLLVSAGTLFAVACSSPKAKPAEAVSPKDSVSAERQTFPAAKQKLTADLQVPGELVAYQQPADQRGGGRGARGNASAP